MKITVVNQTANMGGGVRYDRALLIAIKKNRPDIDITYFAPVSKIKAEGIYKELLDAGINIKPILNFTPFSIQAAHRIKQFISGTCFSYGDRIIETIRRIKRKAESALPSTYNFKRQDLVFFTWPYFISCPDVECPVFFIPHDFNYKYFFGAHIYTKEMFDTLSRQHEEWLEKAKPVVSTHFMAAEIAKFYPKHKDKVSVVHLAPFSSLSDHSEIEASGIVQKLGINFDYILYPCNTTYHKNLGALISAVHLLNKRGKNIKLVYAGYNTQGIKGRSGYLGVEHDDKNFDVIGLGYVSNEEIDALIQCAKAVVTPSLYEAGNGPGLDAWLKGTPVAMSDIPAFTEHIKIQGVRARLFDPKDPHDMADQIEWILDNPQQAGEDAMYSREKIKEWSWDNVARKYIQIFENEIAK